MWTVKGVVSPKPSCVRVPWQIPHHGISRPARRTLSTPRHSPHSSKQALATKQPDAEERAAQEEEQRGDAQELGAMSRLLDEMTESSLQDGGASAAKAVQEGGFDEQLKQRLLNRIEEDRFRAQNVAALAEADLPAGAGEGTRQQAAALPWSGSESVQDATLRMLHDSHKPLRRSAKVPGLARPPKKVDAGRPSKSKTTGSGVRLATARDRSSVYSNLRDASLSDKERAELRAQLKDRFEPSARPLPATVQGLASLANKRIEDAIARGQFKNLPRGKKLERDPNMSSPFLDTTEYFMNKIIKKQDIVPPWIEKQQELVATATNFRTRLRNDWRRHAARLIASRGGSLESQIQTAQQYAEAEAIVNPPAKKKETLNAVDDKGHMSQITLTGELKPKTAAGESGEGETLKITVTEDSAENVGLEREASPSTLGDQQAAPAAGDLATTSSSSNPRIVAGTVFPFRDANWEETERSYHKLAIENLNSMTRSYNLMAPNLAKKPYFWLERELRACFADVAPQLAGEIRDRAKTPKVKVEVVNQTSGGVLEHLAGGSARIYDDTRPQYGFKEFWRDVFASWRAR